MDPGGCVTVREALAARLAGLAGVHLGPSRVGNARHTAAFVGESEFAHFHSDVLLDVRVGRKRVKEFGLLSQAVPRRSASDWMEFRLESEGDAEAVWQAVVAAWEDARQRARE